MGRAEPQDDTAALPAVHDPVEHRPTGFVGVGTMFRIELPVVLVLMFAVLFLANWSPLRTVFPMDDVYLLLGLASAGTAASASIVAGLTGRLLDDRLLLGLGVSLAFYGIVVMPLSVGRLAAAGPSWERAALIGAAFSFVGMMALTVFAGRSRAYSQVLVALLALACTAAFGVLGELVPWFGTLVYSPVPAALVFAGLCALAVVLIAHGVSHEHAVTWRVGLGMAVLAVAHLLRAASGPQQAPGVAFFALRLLGLVVLLGGLAVYARESAIRVRAEQQEEYRRLRAAGFEAERSAELTAERDHEMRNMIAGISGATQLLGGTPQSSKPGATGAADDATGQLGAAVRTELDRLRDLLERPAQSSAESSTPVATLLMRLVMLQRATGANIELEVARGMRVAMPAAPLAQVITNLLVNCSRYAPGTPVTIVAGAKSGMGWIEVTDAGPGPALSADGSSTGGSGLGLTVSSRLLAAHGGSLKLAKNEHGPGCTATVEVPLAADEAPAPGANRGTLMVGLV